MMSVSYLVAAVLALAPAATTGAGAAEPSAPGVAAPTETVGGPVAVTTRLEPEPASIGDVLTYEVIATYPQGYSVNLPTTVDLGPHHLVAVEEGEPKPVGDKLRKSFTLEFQAFTVGDQRVPAFPLTYVTPQGAVETVSVPVRSFEIASLLANEPDPRVRGDDPPVAYIVEARWAETAAWAVLATLVALALLAWAWLRWRKVDRTAPAPPPLPPEVVAEQALSELERGDLLKNERYADFYLQLTEILKGYLEGRFEFEALDRTTDEIRHELVSHPQRLAPLSGDEVVALLQRCDLVKFARMQSSEQQAEEAVAEVRELVACSTAKAEPPKPEPPESASGAAVAQERER